MPATRFVLGGRTYDLTARSLVIASTGPADVIEVADPSAVAAAGRNGLPVAIMATGLDAVRAGYQAGAVLGRCPDPAFVALSAQAGASVIVANPRPALAAGIAADLIAVESPSPGHPWLVTTDDVAVAALAITGGARLIRTTNPKAMRRVCDVLAAVLEASQ